MEESGQKLLHNNSRTKYRIPDMECGITTSTNRDRTGPKRIPVADGPLKKGLTPGLTGILLMMVLIISGAAGSGGTGIVGSGTRLLGSDVNQLEKNRLEIDAMDVRQLNELRTKKTRFDKLLPAEKDRLRRLHINLQSHPDRLELETTMLRYMDWLKSLDPVNQAEVLDKQGDERLREISRMRYQQSRQHAVLSPSDNVEFEAWFRSLAESKPGEVSEAVDRIAIRRRGYFRPEKTASHEAMLRYVIASSERESAKILTAEVIQDLDNRLSSRGREILKAGDNVRAIRILVSNPVSEFELRRFFEEKLTPEQRAELDRLSPDEMKRKIRRMYIASQLGIASDRN